MGDLRIHAIMTRYSGGMGFSVSSPQLPELVAGFETDEELENELLSVLSFGGAPKEYTLVKHYQEYSSNEGREWYVRTAHDVKLKERVATLHAFSSLIRLTPEPLDRATKSTTGEATFVIALLDDKFGWLSEQLSKHGSALTIVVRSGEGLTTFDLLSDDMTVGFPVIKVDPERTVEEILASLEHTHRQVPGVDFVSGEVVEPLYSSRTLVSV